MSERGEERNNKGIYRQRVLFFIGHIAVVGEQWRSKIKAASCGERG